MELPFPEMGMRAEEAGLGQAGNQEFSFDHVKLEMPLTPANGGLAAQAAGRVVWAGNTALGITRVEMGLKALGWTRSPSKGTPSTKPQRALRLSDQGDEAEAELIKEVGGRGRPVKET